MTKTELLKKIAALGKISDAQKRSVTCSLIGHSRVVSMCFGYVNCGRCEDQIGDTLGGASDMSKRVAIGHRDKETGGVCATCLTNYKKLDWRDKVFLPEETLDKLLDGLDLKPAAKKTANRRKR
jgi:hypothetical protein